MSRRSSAELKELCIAAYEKQIEALAKSEGPESLLSELKAELKEVRKINPEKADKEGNKYVF